jgi:hypothetical protein
MDKAKYIVKQKQLIARQEKELALEKLKKRRADTRRKIELGGLVIKSTMDTFGKAIILGALTHAQRLMSEDENYVTFFNSIGENQFLEK